MQTSLTIPSLPDTPELREKMAEIISGVCRCERQPLLDDQSFFSVITQFDSLAVLEIMLEVETVYHIQTDDMLPIDPEKGAQEIMTQFPTNLSELVVYMREVVAQVQKRELELAASSPSEQLHARRQEQAERAQVRAKDVAVAPQPSALANHSSAGSVADMEH